jgi:hypothetical protein
VGYEKIRNEGVPRDRGPPRRCYATKLGPLALTRRLCTLELRLKIPIGYIWKYANFFNNIKAFLF